VELFHWSLYEIDRTDIESLIPFMFRYVAWKNGPSVDGAHVNYVDQVNWL